MARAGTRLKIKPAAPLDLGWRELRDATPGTQC
jgi:hypothetical protein